MPTQKVSCQLKREDPTTDSSTWSSVCTGAAGTPPMPPVPPPLSPPHFPARVSRVSSESRIGETSQEPVPEKVELAFLATGTPPVTVLSEETRVTTRRKSTPSGGWEAEEVLNFI